MVLPALGRPTIIITSHSSLDLGPASSGKVEMRTHVSSLDQHADSHHGNQCRVCLLTFGLDKVVLVSLLDGGIPLRGIKGKWLQMEINHSYQGWICVRSAQHTNTPLLVAADAVAPSTPHMWDSE